MRDFITSVQRLLAAWASFLTENPLELFPLRKSLRRYNGRKFKSDLLAGTNVAMLAIPQSMAFAMIAGLDNVAYGITCTAVGCLLGGWLSSSRLTSLGPTNATSLMIYSALAGTGLAAADRGHLLPVLVFLAGLLLVVGAYLRMADMIQYISRSVVVGYVTGAGCLILAGQLRETLGIPAPKLGSVPHSRGVVSLLNDTFSHLGEVQWQVALVSLGTLVVYLMLKRVAPKWPCFAITLLGVSVLMAVLHRNGVVVPLETLAGFTMTQVVPVTPDFRDAATFGHMGILLGPAMAVAFLAALEQSVMAKTLASRTGERPDQNQDLLSVGVANLGAALVGQLPVSGSLTRSSFNYESGAATQVASLVTGLICLGAVFFSGWTG